MEMDLVSSCKEKLQYFCIKDLKDIFTQLGLSKQGKKQELVDRILAIIADDQVSKIWAKKHAVRKEEVARLVDDTYRKMQMTGATDLASCPQVASDSTLAKPVEDIDDSSHVMKIRCLCGSSLPTESMIQCEDPKCQIWQHMSCVIIPEKPTEGTPPIPPQFYCELCRLIRADPTVRWIFLVFETFSSEKLWQCPICFKNYSLEHVIVDPYFNRVTSMMRFCGEDTTDIEVKPDGSWRVKSDSEHWDLRQWHLPDGSVIRPSDGVKLNPETSKAVKHEVTGLKLGIKKNINGVWEVNKPGDMNTASSSEGPQENHMSNGPNIIPMSSSATESGREGEDLSVNQDANRSFDFSVNNSADLDSMYLNLDQTYGFSNQNASSPARSADVIVLSDSEEENGDVNQSNDGHADTGGVSFSLAPHGLPDMYQEDPALGASGGLDLFTSADDDFGMSLWQLSSATQAGPSFQLFGSDAGVSDGIVDLHHSSMPMNGYSLPSDAAINPAGFVLDSSVGHSNNNDHNDSLVDNPLAFGREDPSLQLFLPTRLSESSGRSGSQHQQDASTGIQTEDWISLRLGDGGGGGGGGNNGEAAAQNGFNSGNLLHSNDGSVQSLAETALLLLNDTPESSDRARQRSNSPFSFPRQRRSVRPRLYL